MLDKIRPSDWPLPVLVAMALVAFAANSLLARAALESGAADAGSFTLLRLLSGAAALFVLVGAARGRRAAASINWRGAASLLLYAVCFSFAYLSLEAGLGALLLFATVQTVMIAAGFWGGERTTFLGAVGAAIAMGGMVYLLAPGASAPDLFGAALMVASGVGWAVYSLGGRSAGDPIEATTGNFLGASALCVLLAPLALIDLGALHVSTKGIVLAALSGAIASGCGYVIWFAALSKLSATRAAILQLGTPLLAALGGVLMLSEPMTWRLVLSAAAILGGVGLFLSQREQVRSTPAGE